MHQQLTFRYIVRIFLCWGLFSMASPVAAQSQYWPTGVQLGMEVSNPLYYKYYRKQIDEQYEFNASIDFARLLVEGDYGWGSGKRLVRNLQTKTNTVYSHKGKYFRVGLNYNMVPDTPDRNTAFLGLRYARNFFQNSRHATSLAIPKHGTVSWYEVVAGVKIKVWTILYVGSTVRYKWDLSCNQTWRPPYIGGWGAYSQGDESMLGLTYYVSLRIPFERL